MTPVSPCTRFLWSGAALRASDSEKLEPPDWPMRLRAVCSIATGWRWRMMRDEPRKTNTALCFGTENVMEEKEEEIVLGSPVLGPGRASTFLYPRGQGRGKWEFLAGAKEEELYPPCLIEQIDLAPHLDPSPLVVVRPFLPLIGAALCPSEEDTLHTNHRAARLHSPAPQRRVTPALLPHTHSRIRSHTRSRSQTRPDLSMECHPECHPSLNGLDRPTETCVPQTLTPPLQSLVPQNQMLLPRTLLWLILPTWIPLRLLW